MTAVDLTNCADEPIHIPGAIQPHGVLFVCREPELIIEQVSANVAAQHGLTPAEAFGVPLHSLFAEAQRSTLLRAAQDAGGRAATAMRLIAADGARFDAMLHRPLGTTGLVVAELEPMSGDEPGHFGNAHLRSALLRLQRATDIDSLTALAAEQVRAVTGFDRVMVYRFDADWNGEVVAEDRREGLDSFLHQHYPASDIPVQARRLYELNWLRLIADVAYVPARLVDPTRGPPLDMSHAVLRSVSPIHVEYLRNMGVRASMSLSLLHDGRLIGLIACHHYSGPRVVRYLVRETAEYLAQALSWNMSVLDRARTAEQNLETQKHEAEVVRSVSISNDLVEGLAVPSLIELAAADGVAIVVAEGVKLLGRTPDESRVAMLVEWLKRTEGDVFVTDNLGSHLREANEWESNAAGLLAVAIAKDLGEYILWFRPSTERVINWAGNPHHAKLVAATADAPARLSPRGSFALWKETVKGRSLPWLSAQIDAASSLRQVLLAGVRRRGSELREINQRLVDADRAKDEFIATVSHELRSPLNAISGWTHLMKSGTLSTERTAVAIEIIARNASTQTRLIEDLLDVSRMTSGKLLVEQVVVELPALVKSALESTTLATDAKSIQLIREIDADATPVLGDPARLRQVLTNLINNAVKFTPKGGTIHVRLRRVGSDVELSVRDNGQGITASFLPHIFEVFRQEDAGMNRRSQGLGLGLAIVRKLVELHGGRIAATSAGVGQGAELVVVLPRAATRITPELPLPPKGWGADTGVARLDGLRVLLVEDDDDARVFVEHLLTETGANVTLTANAEAALAAVLDATSFDVVLSDIGLPGTDGLELMRRLRARPAIRGGRIPSVALTAYTRAADRIQALQAGFDTHIGKPVVPAELVVVLASVARSRLRD